MFVFGFCLIENSTEATGGTTTVCEAANNASNIKITSRGPRTASVAKRSDGRTRWWCNCGASIQQRAVHQVKRPDWSRWSGLSDQRLGRDDKMGRHVEGRIFPHPSHCRQIGVCRRRNGNGRLSDLASRAGTLTLAAFLFGRRAVVSSLVLGAHRAGRSLVFSRHNRLRVCNAAPAHRRTDEESEHHCQKPGCHMLVLTYTTERIALRQTIHARG